LLSDPAAANVAAIKQASTDS